MTLQTLTYLVVGASFALYIAIALRTRAARRLYVAGSGVHPIANGMATAALMRPRPLFPWRDSSPS